MITIRRAQMQEFGILAMQGFEARAALHVQKYFPEQCAKIGSAEIERAVRYGIERARSYRLATERDLLRYLTLMFTFGKDFDRDPALPWAGAVLNGAGEAGTRTDLLQIRARNNRGMAAGYTGRPSPAAGEEK